MSEGEKSVDVVGVFRGEESIQAHVREISHGEGGISLKLEDVGVWETMVSFARKLIGKMLSGNLDFSSLQRPAAFIHPESHVVTVVKENLLLIRHIQAMLHTADPLERLKLLVAGVLGSLSFSVYASCGKGPVASCLGETFQGSLGDGGSVYGEQLSVSPHTTQLLFLGPNGEYELSSLVRVELQVRG